LGLELGDECGLLGSLDGVRAVRRSNPTDSIDRCDAAQDGKASKRRSGASVCTDASNFDELTGAGSLERRAEGDEYLINLRGHSEVGPFQVGMPPGWVPLRIEIQPELGLSVALIGLDGWKGGRGNRRSVREDHQVLVLMDLCLPAAVVRVDTLCTLVHRPAHPTVSAHLNGCDSHRHDVSRRVLVDSATVQAARLIRCLERGSSVSCDFEIGLRVDVL